MPGRKRVTRIANKERPAFDFRVLTVLLVLDQLVEDASDTPDVSLQVVVLKQDYFWRPVIPSSSDRCDTSRILRV